MIENESLLDRQVNPDPPENNRRKLKKIFIAIAFVGLGVLVGSAIYGYIDAERIARTDTYGGKTPAETLQLHIDALKKRDFELASKYFVLSAREWKFNAFNKNSENKKMLDRYIEMLEEASKKAGTYSPDGKTFYLDSPIYEISYRMILYPSGVWKIDMM